MCSELSRQFEAPAPLTFATSIEAAHTTLFEKITSTDRKAARLRESENLVLNLSTQLALLHMNECLFGNLRRNEKSMAFRYQLTSFRLVRRCASV